MSRSSREQARARKAQLVASVHERRVADSVLASIEKARRLAEVLPDSAILSLGTELAPDYGFKNALIAAFLDGGKLSEDLVNEE